MRNKAQWIPFWGIIGVLVLLVGLGWLARDRFLPVDVGDPAPGFVVRDMPGDPVSLDDLKGQVVLLNIWATWCAPCREEMPSMQRLHDAMGAQGLRVIAVSIDAPIGLADRGGNVGGNVAEFADELGLTFPIWLDPASDTYRKYRLTAVPESFVIDKSGTIVKKQIGPTEWDSPAMQELFTRLIQE